MTTALLEKHEGVLGGEVAGTAEDQRDVRLWLRLLSTTMTVEKRVQRRLTERGTTLPRFDVLAALDRYPDGLTMTALSRMLLVSNGNVTALVKTLAAEGLVATRQSPEDRRVSCVTLTAAGARQFADLAGDHRDWIEGMFSGLTPAKKAELFALLGRLKTSIAAEDR